MDINSLVVSIALICGLETNSNESVKIKCIDYMVNCAVGSNGEIKQDKVEKCKVIFFEKNLASK